MEGVKKIESTSIEQHQNELEKQFSIFMLTYVERLYQKKIPLLEESYIEKKYNEKGEKVREEVIKIDPENFKLLLARYSDILRDFIVAHKQIEEPEAIQASWTDEEYENLSKIYADKILNLYESDQKNWISHVFVLLKVMQEEIKKKKEKIETPASMDNQVDKKRAGIVSMDVERGEKYFDMFKETGYDVDKNDIFLEIHLRPLYTLQYNAPEKNIFSEDSLKNIALEIVDNHPEVKAIIGKSWLMDTAIASRIGFQIVKREPFLARSFWGQFQDSKGQLVKERVEEFLKTGKAPYQVATGVIDTVDFLKKYLPKEKRGVITLKEKNPDFDYDEFYGEKTRSIFLNWDLFGYKELKKKLMDNKYILMFERTPEGKGVIDFLLQNKKDNISYGIFSNTEEYKKYVDGFNNMAKMLLYKDKEIIIE